MQFINIVVHSVENMNFRVHLQYEFTHLGLDKYLGVSMQKKRKVHGTYITQLSSFNRALPVQA